MAAECNGGIRMPLLNQGGTAKVTPFVLGREGFLCARYAMKWWETLFDDR